MSEILTAKEKAMQIPVVADPNVIPPMTHPYGQHWKQPDRAEILIDDKHAVMSKSSLEKLLDYSNSQPSGVYEGKMWRVKIGKPTRWFLCWFGYSQKPDCCSNNHREILIVA